MKRFWIGLCAAIVFALCATGTVWIVRSQIRARAIRAFIAAGPANLAREQAAAKAAGISLDPKQLQQPLPPPSQNAALDYVRLTKLLHDKPLHLPKYAEGMDAYHSYTPTQIAAARNILAERQDVMTLVHQAADKPKCVFVRDWNQGIDVKFPELQTIRVYARLIKTESYLLARDGHYQEAVSNQARGFRVAEHAASDHVLLGYLVGNASEAIALTGMQSIMASAGPNASTARDVQQAISLSRPHLSLQGALRNAPAAMEPIFPQLHRGQGQRVAWFSAAVEGMTHGKDIPAPPPGKPASPTEQKMLSDMIDDQQAVYLADVRRFIAVLNTSEPARRSTLASMSDPPAEEMEGGERTLSYLLLPDTQKLDLDDDDNRIHAREAVTQAAAAVLAERAKAGAYPDSLPSGFTDPYTGHPLQYRREGANGFVVYSVGPTGRFDGGQPGQKAPGTEALFRYPAVPIPTGG